MTKKYHMRRHFKGGFLDSLGQTFSNLGTSISQGASSVWNKTKKATGMDNTSSYSSSSSYTPSTSSTYTPSTSSTAPTNSTSSTYSYGGKRVRKSTRKIKRAKTKKPKFLEMERKLCVKFILREEKATKVFHIINAANTYSHLKNL